MSYKKYAKTVTKYGPAISVILVNHDEIDGVNLCVFLPKRFVDELSDQEISEFNKNNVILHLTYINKMDKTAQLVFD